MVTGTIIVIDIPANITTPPAGEVAFFLDSSNNNILSYKDENGEIHIYNNGNAADAGCSCICDIMKDTMSKLSSGVECGNIDSSFLANLSVSGVSTTTTTPTSTTTTVNVVFNT